MKAQDQDVLSGGLLIFFALVGYWAGSQLQMSESAGISAAFYPNVLFTVLLFCGLSLIYQGVKRERKQPLPTVRWEKIIPIVVALSIYVLLMEYTGFIVSTIVFLIFAMYIFGERRKKTLAAVPIVTSLVVYFLFSKAFMIVLP